MYVTKFSACWNVAFCCRVRASWAQLRPLTARSEARSNFQYLILCCLAWVRFRSKTASTPKECARINWSTSFFNILKGKLSDFLTNQNLLFWERNVFETWEGFFLLKLLRHVPGKALLRGGKLLLKIYRWHYTIMTPSEYLGNSLPGEISHFSYHYSSPPEGMFMRFTLPALLFGSS